MKVDQSNEIIRGDLNSVRYELETLKEERQLEKIKHEQELRALEASVEEQAKRVDVSFLRRWDALCAVRCSLSRSGIRNVTN